MAKERRVLRLQQLVLETVAQALQAEIEDPRVGMVSITKVRLSPDLSRGTIFWSVLGEDAQRRTTARGLEDATPFLQRRVAEAMGTRVTPELSMRYDPSLEKARRLDDIFNRLRAERGEPPAETKTPVDGDADEDADEDDDA